MSYTVLARRFRSRDFDEVVAQEPIARTLQNAIAAGRTAHAYLFSGTRGVGKTSMARIFAKALNVTPDLAQAGEIAEAILRGDDLDVVEIDGASNRGIQEARDLIAGAGLSPARCPYKIYIIDEVHMLTREAFNALLKTMEEPPSHVKFILCTTEPHKVPATIQSRCQRFDFRPLPTARIAEHLASILEQEGIDADEAVVAHVARLGHGSMRDALSLLDRLLAAGEKRLTMPLLEQMLGVPDTALLVALVDAIAGGDPASALEATGALLGSGATVSQVLELLTEHLRLLMVAAACGADSDLLDVPPDLRETAGRQAGHFDAPALVHMIALCDAVARSAQGSSVARALLDAAVVRLCLAERLADIASLLGDGSGGKKKDPERVAPPLAPEAPAPAPAPVPARLDGEALWATVCREAARSHIDQARIDHLRYGRYADGVLHLTVDEAGSRMARFLAGQSGPIGELVGRAAGRPVRVEIDASTAEAAGETAGPLEGAALDEVRSLPAVAEAVDMFDGTVVAVRDIEERSDQ